MAKTKNKKQEEKNIMNERIRKIVNYVLLMIAIILVCLLSLKVARNIQNSKYQTSVLNKVVGTISLDALNEATKELTSDDFILISYTGSKEVRQLEKDIKKVILDNDLQSNFFYLNVTDFMLEDNYIKALNDEFKLKGKDEIKAVPAILYFKDGKFVKTLTSTNDQMLRIDDLAELLDSYEIIGSEERE